MISRMVFAICCLTLLATSVLYYPKWKKPLYDATIGWDVSGYYLYLPAVFIYHDLKQLDFKDSILQKYHPTPDFGQAFRHPSGNYVMKYTAGQAVAYSPFFFTAHCYASVSGNYPNDGFSLPYQLAISIGMLLYAFLGLYLLRKTLLRYFSDAAVALTLIAVVLATNYLNYAGIESAMTHSTLFTVYALLLYASDCFYREPELKSALAIGAFVGLATLIRPTECISVLLPLFWSFKGLRNRLATIRQHWRLYGAAAMVAALVVLVQLIYWKSVAGECLVYSYGDEGFNFSDPHIFDCLFSYKAGWLVYSPVMTFALAGFIFLYRYQRQLFLPVLLFSLLFCYICFSWKVWWYGASLGQRAMIHSYPALAIPLAAFWQFCLRSNRVIRIIALLVLAATCWYNGWLTHQAHLGKLLRPEEMNREYFWAIFGRNKVDAQAFTLLDNDYLYKKCIENPLPLYANNFEQDTSGIISGAEAINGKSTYVDADKQFTPEYTIALPPAARKRLRAVADFRVAETEWTYWKMTQMVLRFYQGDSIIQSNLIRPGRLLNDGVTNRVYMDARVPEQPFDKVTVLFWNAGGDKRTVIDNLEVISF